MAKSRAIPWLSVGILLVSLFIVIEPAIAQDPAEVSPDIYQVLFENEDIRVLELTYEPGERDQPHSHPKYSVLVLQSGKLRAHAANGDSAEIDAEKGRISHLDPVDRHWAENVGETTVRAIAIEYKSTAN